MYCFCVGKIVVHVPTGGDLKRMTISSSTGERTVVISTAKGLDEGYWPAAPAERKRIFSKIERRSAVCTSYPHKHVAACAKGDNSPS